MLASPLLMFYLGLASAKTPPESPLIKKELNTIAETCLSPKDYELLTGNALKYLLITPFIGVLIKQSVSVTGLQELRSKLKFSPPPHWKKYNETLPSYHELTSATLEEYYDLREPRVNMRSLDQSIFFEHNIHTAIGYLDKRIPSIRTIFKETFKEAYPEVLDKKAIDKLIGVFSKTVAKIDRATTTMLSRFKCKDEDFLI
uniref:Fatty-acid and retinol-binding protein 1 n=1 Tax=Caenorhabditis tropicalis TaxID=1561998 RepID=A0A1I7UP30_9PELO